MPFTADDEPTEVRQPLLTPRPRVLIADQERDALDTLRRQLGPEGLRIEAASSASGVLAALERREFDLALLGVAYLRTRPGAGPDSDFLFRIHRIDPILPVVAVAAQSEVGAAIEATFRGAHDFIQKPWEDARLLAIVRTQIALGRALRRERRLEADNVLLHRLESMSLEDVESLLIKRAMTRCEGNVSRSARALGLSRSALYRRLQRHGR